VCFILSVILSTQKTDILPVIGSPLPPLRCAPQAPVCWWYTYLSSSMFASLPKTAAYY